ncbi:ATP phosphoribosyltransferase [Aerococcus agrisoli]|uniref:ATP phosphoribosyltransferase n=1 Tax=Aerococcus agrisoli TaxID=2487350 RepID=A0A3N4GDZ7_9LACT|nr:ATP phosphoribosyltransferase [Aerococcus agrisoli]RPA61009.1 ATP phosphoribosyltransferase [Aerococcus agrisoli]
MITIALAKGRVYKAFNEFLADKDLAGYADGLQEGGRDLFRVVGDVKFIFAKGKDVPTYVEQGVADLGVVGSDTITEKTYNVLNVSELPFGQCRLAIAGPTALDESDIKVVATSFPNLTRQYFNQNKQDVDIVFLNGSVELAPILGLSDAIVDIVQTGTTLKENDLREYKTILPVQARLIANKQSFYIKEEGIYQFMQEIGVV